MGLVISVQHNFVFIHIPKNAGQTIWSILSRYEYNDVLPEKAKLYPHLQRLWDISLQDTQIMARATEAGHWRYVDLVKVLGQIWVDKQKIYAVVRNPWDKAVSSYLYDVATKPALFNSTTTFDDWLGWMNQFWTNPLELQLYSQYPYIVQGDGNLPRNLQLLRFESIVTDFAQMQSDVGLVPPPGLSSVDITNTFLHQAKDRKPYQEYYTSATRDLVGKLFQHDVETFKYGYAE